MFPVRFFEIEKCSGPYLVNHQGLTGCHLPPTEMRSRLLIDMRDDDLLTPVKVKIPRETVARIVARAQNPNPTAVDRRLNRFSQNE
jgi:hypothetical protein